MEEIIKRLDSKLKVIKYEYIDDTLLITAERINKSAICPCCGKKSTKIHSKYMRTIKDLPIQENKVILNIVTKVFFCKNEKCNTNTFAEQFDFIESHSRMSTRLKNKIVETSKGMSARYSKAIINKDIANISDDTILRLIKKTIEEVDKDSIKMICIDDFALKKRQNYGTVMIDIETHKIIDMIDSREEEKITEWLKTYPNLEIISRDGGITYKSASDKAHPKAKQISDRFHILKNLTDYAKDVLKRLLKKQIKINEKEKEQKEISKQKKKYKYKTKWDLISKIKELKKQKYRIIDIAEYLGISEKSVIEYNKIPEIDKEKYEQISLNELKSQVSNQNKWQLIQEVQEEYKKCNKYSIVAKKFKLDDRTVKKYLNITEPPINGNKNRDYSSKLDKYKNKIIKMNNKGYKWKIIKSEIQKDGYNGSDSLLRKYLSKIKKEQIEETEIKYIVERTTMISLLYKEIDKVKNITKDIFDKVISMYPRVEKIYEIIKKFKEIMFSKKEQKIDKWIKETKKLNIPEINSFINRIRKRFRGC